MKKELYDLLDLGRIEGLVYSEENQPHDLLGACLTEYGVLFQAFALVKYTLSLTVMITCSSGFGSIKKSFVTAPL